MCVRVFATLATWPKKHFPVISPCKHKCTVIHHVAATKNVVACFKYVSDIVGGVEIGWLPMFCFAKEGVGVIYCGLGLLIRFLAICMFCFNDWMTFGTFATDCSLVHLLQWLVDGYDWVCSKKTLKQTTTKHAMHVIR